MSWVAKSNLFLEAINGELRSFNAPNHETPAVSVVIISMVSKYSRRRINKDMRASSEACSGSGAYW